MIKNLIEIIKFDTNHKIHHSIFLHQIDKTLIKSSTPVVYICHFLITSRIAPRHQKPVSLPECVKILFSQASRAVTERPKPEN